jgi:acetyl esterase/lipase
MLGGADWENNPYVFTSNMPLELMSKVPPTVLFTAEFDFFRIMCERVRPKYEEAGTLLDYGMMKGTTHGGSFVPGSSRFDAMFTSLNPLVEEFL